MKQEYTVYSANTVEPEPKVQRTLKSVIAGFFERKKPYLSRVREAYFRKEDK